MIEESNHVDFVPEIKCALLQKAHRRVGNKQFNELKIVTDSSRAVSKCTSELRQP